MIRRFRERVESSTAMEDSFLYREYQRFLHSLTRSVCLTLLESRRRPPDNAKLKLRLRRAGCFLLTQRRIRPCEGSGKMPGRLQSRPPALLTRKDHCPGTRRLTRLVKCAPHPPPQPRQRRSHRHRLQPRNGSQASPLSNNNAIQTRSSLERVGCLFLDLGLRIPEPQPSRFTLQKVQQSLRWSSPFLPSHPTRL
jgi:hypothetical protein